MATVCRDGKGVLMVEFMQQGTKITPQVYFETLTKLRRAIQNERHGMLRSSVLLLHDNAHPHTTAHTRPLLEHFIWELFDHLPYSPDLAPSDYHLCTYLKKSFRSQRFNSNEELTGMYQNMAKLTDFFDTGIQNPILRYDKCLNSGGDFVEK
jgi:hypothetical protein